GIVHYGVAEFAVFADNGILEHRIIDDSILADGDVGADNGIGNGAALANAYRRNNDGVGKFGVLGIQKFGAVEQNGVGLQKCFFAAAIVPVVYFAGAYFFALLNEVGERIGEVIFVLGFNFLVY